MRGKPPSEQNKKTTQRVTLTWISSIHGGWSLVVRAKLFLPLVAWPGDTRAGDANLVMGEGSTGGCGLASGSAVASAVLRSLEAAGSCGRQISYF